jgi:D-aminoacyl-tRNA deacylase
MRVLVTSVQDTASQTIHGVLTEKYGFEENGSSFEGNPLYSDGNSLLITTNRDMIQCDHLEQYFDAEVFIFCSRHRAQSGKPALLVHSTGNFGEDAQFGGNPRELSVSASSLIKTALQTLYLEREKGGLDEFDVTLEVTHHGPTSMKTPLLFVELGSDESFWRHERGAMAVAAAAMSCTKVPLTGEASIGFGGTHYASKFNKLVLDKEIDIGHIAPKYVLSDITENVVSQMIERSSSEIKRAIIDWKGTNAENKARIFPILENLDIEIIRASRI